MPRKPIDYSNTIIYKLCCNDLTITDVYVGHTIDFVCRKSKHKRACNNETVKDYTYYVYKFIREHGGWDNWSMVELERLSCIDKIDACKNERRWIETLKSTLNKQIPTRTDKEYYLDNKEEKLKYNKEYKKQNPELIAKLQKKYRDNNIEKCRTYQREYMRNYRLKKLSDATEQHL
jgi:hypothetical protein